MLSQNSSFEAWQLYIRLAHRGVFCGIQIINAAAFIEKGKGK
jgi:hypothetical protein